MNDDELGRFLRDEIPEPDDGYWEEIDARIAAEAGQRPSPVADLVTDVGQTDVDVIRLTDMRPITGSPRSTLVPRLVAMAAALVLVAGIAVVVTRSDDPDTSTDVAESTDPAPDTDPAPATDEPAPGDGSLQPSPDEPAPITDEELGEALLDPIAPGEYVVVGAATVEAKLNPITDEAGLDAFFEPGDDVLSATGRRALYQGVEFVEMIVDADAKPLWFPAGAVLQIGETLPTLEGSQVEAWEFGSILLSRAPGLADAGEVSASAGELLEATGRRALVDHREWLQISAAGERRWVLATEVVPVDAARGLETLSPIASAEWEVGRGGELEILDRPGFDGTLVGGAEIGGIVSGTGVRALADGLEWYEVLIAEGQVGWVMANTVQAPDTILGSSRQCYADGADVLAITFSGDAETFTGVFAVGDSVEAVAGVRLGADFLVAIEPIGAAEEAGFEVGQETWQAFAAGFSIGERAFLEIVECRTVQSTVDQLDALVGTYPDVPFPD
ncbi:MAG: hypothetical protein AAF081_01175 [Actinomycetota bacterium]